VTATVQNELETDVQVSPDGRDHVALRGRLDAQTAVRVGKVTRIDFSWIGEMLASIERTLRNVERFDFGAISQLLQADLKSAGKVLDKVDQVDFAGLGTNVNSPVTELRSSKTKLKSFIEDADDTVKRMKPEKLTQDFDGLVDQLRETIAKVEPGLANIDFDALNQTLAKAQRTMHDMDDVILELKQYPAGVGQDVYWSCVRSTTFGNRRANAVNFNMNLQHKKELEH